MKLNNKGITTIEVIICFVLVVIITVSMYTIISTFNEKKIVEGYKEETNTYINILTKDIQDDFIKKGIDKATYSQNNDGAKTIDKLDILLKDGTSRSLIVEKTVSKSEYHPDGDSNVDDDFLIKYGSSDNLIEYPIPDLGSFKSDGNHTIKDLSINTVSMSVSENNILSIYIGFYHPDLGRRYAIDIVYPINYNFEISTDTTDSWEGLV